MSFALNRNYLDRNRQLRIAVWHNLPSGGGKRALYYHVRGLVQRGHQVKCWSLDTADHSYLPLSEFAEERIIPIEVGVGRVRRYAAKMTRSYYLTIERLQRFDDACRRSAQEINEGNFDLLFANSATSFHVPYVMRHVQIPKVLYLQEPCRMFYEAMPILPWLEGLEGNLNNVKLFSVNRVMDYPRLQSLRVQARQEWANVRASDSLLVNSYFSRESVLRSYGLDAKVCYLGIDTHLFRDLSLRRQRFILGLGSFDSIKGIDRAVKAVALIHPPRPPLVWISNSGNKDYEQEMAGLAQGLDVDLQIIRAIPDAELVSLLNKATLLLYTSRLEPFGFAPLEANACGLPVVAIAEGGVRETVQDGLNGFLVDSDPQSIAAAANHLLQNPDLARQLGNNGVAHVQRNWNVEHSVDRLEECLYEAVLRMPNADIRSVDQLEKCRDQKIRVA